MEEKTDEQVEQEIIELREDLENFQKEKEQYRAIIGKIGGVPTFHSKLINLLFIAVIVVSLIFSVLGGTRVRLLMIEVATVALSVKIIYLIHLQARVNHFKLWMLSSIEWRINQLFKMVRSQQKQNE